MNIEAARLVITSQLETAWQHYQIPGLSAALVHDQNILWQGGFGLAQPGTDRRADVDTIYRVGSVTKLFTATMLLQLRDAGKLQLDDPIERYLPAFRPRSPFGEQCRPTFRQVASHMAGLPRELSVAGWERFESPTSDQILAQVQETELVFPVMLRYKYSNLGYTILGHALEVIAEQPYTEYVSEHILRPLGMRSSGFNLWEELSRRSAHATFSTAGAQPDPAHYPDMGAYTPMGQLFATAEDLARFVMVQFRENAPADTQILKACTLREMHTPTWIDPSWTFGSAIGWRVGHLAEHTALSHDGLVHGFSADITVVPDLKLGIAVCTNAMTDVAMISRTVLEQLIDMVGHANSPQGRTEINEWTQDGEGYVGHYRVPGLVELDILLDGGRLVGRVSVPFRADIPLRPEGDHRFRMEAGPSEGELAIFNLDQTGRAQEVIVGGFVCERASPGSHPGR